MDEEQKFIEHDLNNAFSSGFQSVKNSQNSNNNGSSGSGGQLTINGLADRVNEISGLSKQMNELFKDSALTEKTEAPFNIFTQKLKHIDDLIKQSSMPDNPEQIELDKRNLELQLMSAIAARSEMFYAMMSGHAGSESLTEANKKVEELGYLNSEMNTNPKRYYAYKELGTYDKVANYIQGVGQALYYSRPEWSAYAGHVANIINARYNYLGNVLKKESDMYGVDKVFDIESEKLAFSKSARLDEQLRELATKLSKGEMTQQQHDKAVETIKESMK